jgi:hypothetical protein
MKHGVIPFLMTERQFHEPDRAAILQKDRSALPATRGQRQSKQFVGQGSARKPKAASIRRYTPDQRPSSAMKAAFFKSIRFSDTIFCKGFMILRFLPKPHLSPAHHPALHGVSGFPGHVAVGARARLPAHAHARAGDPGIQDKENVRTCTFFCNAAPVFRLILAGLKPANDLYFFVTYRY